MTKLTIMRGLQASGKDSLARKWLADSIGSAKPAMIVNRDQLRFMAGLDTKPGPYEDTITLQQHALIRAGLKAGRHVISSDTNLNARYVKQLAKIAEKFGAEIVVYDVDTPLEECISRDIIRGTQGGHMVTPEVIRATHKRYFPGGKFPPNPLIEVRESVKLEPYQRDESLPTAFIFDIDGTKAGMTDRSPYDYTQVHTDTPHMDIMQMESLLFEAGHVIINLSGREDSCRDSTIKWINQHCTATVPDEAYLFMRKTDDDRADYIVKYEIFMKEIAPYFNVLGVFDDRNQVVDMWRQIGLRCYQVNYGDF
jgi:predicted kinase